MLDYFTFGMQLPGRTFNSSDYRYGFNGKEKDIEFTGSGSHLNFGARILDTRLGRWLSVDPLEKKFPGYSSYHFGYCNPIITIDQDGQENIVVVGNQAAGTGDTPSSDFKNSKREEGYRYGENKRHFLEAGLNEALRLKTDKTDDNEATTLVVYKGNYTDEELSSYKERAEKAGINFIEVSSAKEITNYVNAKDVEGDGFGDWILGSDRDEDLITDFSYVGHGWTKALYTGYNAVKSNVDKDPLYTSSFETEAFDLDCDVNLNACASGYEVMDDFVNRLTGGTVTGYTTTIQWGAAGLGTYKPYHLWYYPPGDPRRSSPGRPTVPEKDRTKVEEGKRTK